MKIPPAAVTEGVERAFAYWLNDHPVSMGDILVAAVTAAFTKWPEHSARSSSFPATGLPLLPIRAEALSKTPPHG